MIVRHLVAADNVAEDGTVIDPRRVRHGSLRGGLVWALAGEVDAPTHLNLDFADHHLDNCVVVAALGPGAPVVRDGRDGRDGETYRVASIAPEAFASYGPVDVGRRRVEWLAALHARRTAQMGARQSFASRGADLSPGPSPRRGGEAAGGERPDGSGPAPPAGVPDSTFPSREGGWGVRSAAAQDSDAHPAQIAQIRKAGR